MRKQLTRAVKVRLPQETKERLESEAVRENLDVSDIVRRAVNQYIEACDRAVELLDPEPAEPVRAEA